MTKLSFNIPEEDRYKYITVFDSPYYPDYLDEKVALHKPTLIEFRKIVKKSNSSSEVLKNINERKGRDRVQLCRLFRKFISPDTSVEMLKVKKREREIIEGFGDKFRSIDEVRKSLASRPHEDEALFAILGEYDDRGKKGYDLTGIFFDWFESKFGDDFELKGPRGAGKDLILSKVIPGFPASIPADFIISYKDNPVVIGFARYDTDRGGAQEDDRPRGNDRYITQVTNFKNLPLKILLVNDGPGLLLGSMWEDYIQIEERNPEKVMVCTLKMLDKRFTKEWILK